MPGAACAAAAAAGRAVTQTLSFLDPRRDYFQGRALKFDLPDDGLVSGYPFLSPAPPTSPEKVRGWTVPTVCSYSRPHDDYKYVYSQAMLYFKHHGRLSPPLLCVV